MSLRDSIGQMGWLPVAALLVLLWTIVTAINVTNIMDAYAGASGPFTGQAFVGGAVGVLVLLGFALSVAYVYGEMGETEPAPESFPPR